MRTWGYVLTYFLGLVWLIWAAFLVRLLFYAGMLPLWEGFDEWSKRLRGISQSAKTKDWGQVIKEGEAIRDIYPDYVELGNVYDFLAQAYEAKGEKPKALAELSGEPGPSRAILKLGLPRWLQRPPEHPVWFAARNALKSCHPCQSRICRSSI